MARFDDFAVGDKVRHVRLGGGTVVAVSPEEITIRYDDHSPTHRCTVGRYPPIWFDQWGQFLDVTRSKSAPPLPEKPRP